MTALTNNIKPGDALDATAVGANFNNLASDTNEITQPQIIPNCVDTRHFAGRLGAGAPFTSQLKLMNSHTEAGPFVNATGGALKLFPTVSFQTTVPNGQPCLVRFSFTLAPGVVDSQLSLRVDGVEQHFRRVRGEAAINKRFVVMHHVHLGDGSGDLMFELYENLGNAGWSISDVQLDTLAIRR